ncbi:hypothetical protein V491_04797 [Pseudogymnoascus sp. VKM F-3775]|nr:hypothetical protein V491_04797 [Pseudogymnoascus sp. VKM F-3775]
MLSSKSVANVANLIQSSYREYVKEIHWADKELQEHLHDNLEAFQDTFSTRLTGLSREVVVAWHEKYRIMYRDQESVGSLIHAGDIQLSLQSFVNLKRVSVNNGCEAEAEQYPAAQNGQEIISHPAHWSTLRQFRLRRGGLYVLILKSLAGSQISHNITHFSMNTNGSRYDKDVLSPNFESGGPIFMFENIGHLEINLCLHEEYLYEQESSIAGHLTNRGECKNLQSLTMKLHPHAADAMGGVGKPSTGSPRINWASAYFNPLGGFFPYLRHLEAHRFRIKNEDLLAYLDTLKHTLHSLILSDCIFEPSVLKLFTGIREDVVPPVAILKYSGDR